MQHKAELTFQDQPVDLFFYRQAFERCVATYYVKNEKQQSFSLPSLFFFSTYTTQRRHSHIWNMALTRVFSLSLSLSPLFDAILCIVYKKGFFCKKRGLVLL